MAFSPDGTRIVTGSERQETAKVWDAADGDAPCSSSKGTTGWV